MRLLRLGALLALILGGAVFSIRWVGEAGWYPRRRFIRLCLAEFRTCRSLRDVRALPRQDNLVICRFTDGSWIVARQTTPHAHDWDATVVLDSRGRVHWTAEHLCAGFENYLSPGISSLGAFYSHHAKRLGLRPSW